MKTAMQEWIEWLKAYEYELPIELQIKAKQALEKEKEQIIDAYSEGYSDGVQEPNPNDDYYNQTYNQNK